MASSQGYLDYVLDLLSGVEDLTTRKMMGEYLLYSEGTLFGGVYDDRLLIKETPASASALGATAVPYEGARPMRLVDSDDGDALSRLVGGRLRGAPRGPGSEGPPMTGEMACARCGLRVCETLLVRFGLLRMEDVDVA